VPGTPERLAATMRGLVTPGDPPRTPPAPARPASPLVLELLITRYQPLTGQASLAGAAARIPFHGWIDLMGVIGTLCGDHPTSPPPIRRSGGAPTSSEITS
jgi:hypothetical protein